MNKLMFNCDKLSLHILLLKMLYLLKKLIIDEYIFKHCWKNIIEMNKKHIASFCKFDTIRGFMIGDVSLFDF